MKKLLLLSLFIFPAVIVSFAQRFDVSEQAGVSFTNNTLQKNGFANQVAVAYQLKKHLSLSAFYERNNWASTNNSFGIAFDFISRYFFAGVEAKYASITPYNDDSWEAKTRYTYKSALGYGLHAGSKQKLSKRFSLVEQGGYVWVPFALAAEAISGPSILNAAFPGAVISSAEYGVPNAEVDYLYARIGLSYRL